MDHKLYLDDVRPIPVGFHGARSYEEFVAYIEERGMPSFISFDHDLGRGEAQKRTGNWVPREEFKELKSGYDCAKYLVENDLGIPVDGFAVHSMNPVGKANIEFLLNGYAKHLAAPPTSK